MLKGLCGVDKIEDEVEIRRVEKVFLHPGHRDQLVLGDENGKNDVFDLEEKTNIYTSCKTFTSWHDS